MLEEIVPSRFELSAPGFRCPGRRLLTRDGELIDGRWPVRLLAECLASPPVPDGGFETLISGRMPDDVATAGSVMVRTRLGDDGAEVLHAARGTVADPALIIPRWGAMADVTAAVARRPAWREILDEAAAATPGTPEVVWEMIGTRTGAAILQCWPGSRAIR